jgi:hypothetical protein
MNQTCASPNGSTGLAFRSPLSVAVREYAFTTARCPRCHSSEYPARGSASAPLKYCWLDFRLTANWPAPLPCRSGTTARSTAWSPRGAQPSG